MPGRSLRSAHRCGPGSKSEAEVPQPRRHRYVRRWPVPAAPFPRSKRYGVTHHSRGILDHRRNRGSPDSHRPDRHGSVACQPDRGVRGRTRSRRRPGLDGAPCAPLSQVSRSHDSIPFDALLQEPEQETAAPLSAEEGQQVVVDLILECVGQTVRCTGVVDVLRVLDEPSRFMGESSTGTIWSSSPCRSSVGTSIFLRSSVKSVSENALMHS